MSNRNEASSLVALRELRDMERRRIHEAEQAQAMVEKERREREEARLRAEAERLARQEAERQAAQAREMAESLRLRRELDGARSEIAALRGQLDRATLAQVQLAVAAPLPPMTAPARARPFAWLGLTAGATMLVGALALSAALRPRDGRAVSVAIPAPSAPACPSPVFPEPRPLPVTPPAVAPPAARKLAPRPRPAPPVRPHESGKPPSTNRCDGTDPLCGIDLGAIDDVGKHRRKGDKRNPR
jgi:hypothetical protein